MKKKDEQTKREYLYNKDIIKKVDKMSDMDQVEKADLVIETAERIRKNYVLYEMTINQQKYSYVNNIIHWIFHFITLGIITFLVWQFLQFDTFVYTQDGEGENLIQSHIGGDVNNGTESTTEDKEKE